MKQKNKVIMNKSEFLSEHKHLLNVLKDGDKKDRLKEYIKQKSEMSKYKK
jgi:uncharacterized membrane protein